MHVDCVCGEAKSRTMNLQLTPTRVIVISVFLTVITIARTTNSQLLSPDDDRQTNYSHQNETDDDFDNTPFPSIGLDADGWSNWSQWSTCSRSCDGGISISLRKCNSKSVCIGSSERYRICNMQPCPVMTDFRSTQCSTYNNKPYRGRYYQWLPYIDPLDPCGLACKAKIFNFVAKLATRVEDGTRCRDGSLDMCVMGKCMSVGCDLRLGSDKRIDDCGVCGGDGTSCKRPTYVWTETNLGSCSVSCGKGYQISRPICVDQETHESVDEILCTLSVRPEPRVVECNVELCPAIWISEAWNSCDRNCGGGKQIRDVHCARDSVNGTRIKVSDNNCPINKPITEKSCNMHECPQWFEGPWSECSVTCGSGYHTRIVVCRDVKGNKSTGCANETMPEDKKKCTAVTPCKSQDLNSDENESQDDSRNAPFVLPWVQKLTSPASSVSTEPNFLVGEWSSCSASCGEGIRKRTVECKIFLEFSRTIAKLPDSHCPGIKPPQIEKCYLSQCAIQKVRDDSHEIKRNSFKNNDNDNDDDEDDEDNDETNNEESNIIASSVESSYKKLIPLSKIGIEVSYSWKNAGFTPCTASCLGGTQESNIQCVRTHDQTVVHPYLCDISKKLDAITRTCNDHPCPPRWNISEFGACSKVCGSGVQIRDIQCVHEVTRGLSNTVVVPNNQCPQPPPRVKQFCNVFECPPKWRAERWTKCSRSCGGGVRARKLKCIKEMAFGQIIEQIPSKCPKRRPKTVKVCNQNPCVNPMRQLRKKLHPRLANSLGKLSFDGETFVQTAPQLRITLKVKGKAIVFKGTTVKLRCPRNKLTKKFNRTEWFKDNSKINIGKKLQFNGRGTLRIKNINVTDAGIYSCTWDKINKPFIDLKINQFSASEEDKTVERPNLNTRIENYHTQLRNNKIDNKNNHNYHNRNNWNHLNNAKNTQNKEINKLTNEKRHKSIEEAAESPIESPNPSLDTWEVNYGPKSKTYIADQYTESSENKDFIEPSTQSEYNENRNVPKLQQLLPNMKHPVDSEKTNFRIVSESLTNDSLKDNLQSQKEIFHSSKLLSRTVLGKGNRENVKFDWITTEWTECTVDCGGTGFQIRWTQCYIRFENVSKTVANSFCVDAGLQMPDTIRNCGIPECPFWESGQWSECSDCIRFNVAVQRREVKCTFSNGTILEHNHCNITQKPLNKRECFKENCKGTWISEEWSQCTGKCGETGVQSRIPKCVWLDNNAPAGNACDDKHKPEVLRVCKNEECREACIDKSPHCGIAKSLSMCRISHYQRQCCESCDGQN